MNSRLDVEIDHRNFPTNQCMQTTSHNITAEEQENKHDNPKETADAVVINPQSHPVNRAGLTPTIVKHTFPVARSRQLTQYSSVPHEPLSPWPLPTPLNVHTLNQYPHNDRQSRSQSTQGYYESTNNTNNRYHEDTFDINSVDMSYSSPSNAFDIELKQLYTPSNASKQNGVHNNNTTRYEEVKEQTNNDYAYTPSHNSQYSSDASNDSYNTARRYGQRSSLLSGSTKLDGNYQHTQHQQTPLSQRSRTSRFSVINQIPLTSSSMHDSSLSTMITTPSMSHNTYTSTDTPSSQYSEQSPHLQLYYRNSYNRNNSGIHSNVNEHQTYDRCNRNGFISIRDQSDGHASNSHYYDDINRNQDNNNTNNIPHDLNVNIQNLGIASLHIPPVIADKTHPLHIIPQISSFIPTNPDESKQAELPHDLSQHSKPAEECDSASAIVPVTVTANTLSNIDNNDSATTTPLGTSPTSRTLLTTSTIQITTTASAMSSNESKQIVTIVAGMVILALVIIYIYTVHSHVLHAFNSYTHDNDYTHSQPLDRRDIVGVDVYNNGDYVGNPSIVDTVLSIILASSPSSIPPTMHNNVDNESNQPHLTFWRGYVGGVEHLRELVDKYPRYITVNAHSHTIDGSNHNSNNSININNNDSNIVNNIVNVNQNDNLDHNRIGLSTNTGVIGTVGTIVSTAPVLTPVVPPPTHVPREGSSHQQQDQRHPTYANNAFPASDMIIPVSYLSVHPNSIPTGVN